MRSFVPATRQSSLAALSRPSSANPRRLSTALGVSIMSQRPSDFGASIRSSASSTSCASPGVFTLGTSTPSARQAQARARSSLPHSPARSLMRMMRSAPPAAAPRSGGANSRGPRPSSPARRSLPGRRSWHRRRASPPWREPGRWSRGRRAPSGGGGGDCDGMAPDLCRLHASLTRSGRARRFGGPESSARTMTGMPTR